MANDLMDLFLSIARQADAFLAAPSVENARRAMQENDRKREARQVLDVELERFLVREDRIA